MAQDIPQMFDGIEIRGTGRVVHAVDLVLVQEVIGDIVPVRSGVDLKNDALPVVFRKTCSSWVEGPGKTRFVSEENCVTVILSMSDSVVPMQDEQCSAHVSGQGGLWPKIALPAIPIDPILCN